MGYAVAMLPLTAAVLHLLACRSGDDPAPPASSGDTAASFGFHRQVDLTVTPGVHAGNTFVLDWRPNPGLDLLVVFVDGERYEWSDPTPPLALLGLPPGGEATAQLTGTSALSESLTFATDPVPEPLSGFTLEVSEDGAETPTGWVLMNTYRRDPRAGHIVIVDGKGRPVWWRDAEDLKPVRAHRSADGTAVTWAVTDWALTEDLSVIGRTALDGSEEVLRTAPGLHHDFYEANGQYRYLAFDVNPDIRFGLNDAFDAVSDVVRSVPVDAEEPVTDGFGFFDDYPFAPFLACSHTQIPSFYPYGAEWTHSNSLVPAPDGGTYVNARYLDGLIKLDPTDTFSWQLGGRDGTFVPAEPDQAPLHGHFTHAFDDRVLMFDNQTHGDLPSRVMELRLDEANHTYEAVWVHEEPDGGKVTYLGDARRLPGGNTLIDWSPRGELEEVTADHETVWRLDTPLVTGRVAFFDDLPFARSP